MQSRPSVRRSGASRAGSYLGRTLHTALLGSAFVGCASSQFPNPSARAFDQAGFAVAVDGDWAIVGVPKSDTLNSNAGKALLYQRDGTKWPLRATVTASTPSFGAQFGWSVDISGNRAIVGAFLDASAGLISGAAYIFERTGDVWAEAAKVLVDTIGESGYGKSVSISGDWAVVGAPLPPPPTFAGPGVAWVYRRNPGTGQWTQHAVLNASDAINFIEFGSSVSIDGDVIVVGAEKGVAGGTVAGAAYVFRRQGNSWNEEAKLTASDPEYHDRFGAAVAVSGNRIVVGAKAEDARGTDAGAAYVFVRDGLAGVWSEVQKLTAEDGTAGDNFGYAVDIDDGRILIGAWLADGAASTTGAAYLYRTAGSWWELGRKLTLTGGEYGDGYGASVSISADCGVVGAVNRDVDGLDKAGAAYYYCGLPGPTIPKLDLDIVCCIEIPDPLGPVVLTTRIVNQGNERIVGRRWVETVGQEGQPQLVGEATPLILAVGETIEERHVLPIRRSSGVVAVRLRFEDAHGVRSVLTALR